MLATWINWVEFMLAVLHKIRRLTICPISHYHSLCISFILSVQKWVSDTSTSKPFHLEKKKKNNNKFHRKKIRFNCFISWVRCLNCFTQNKSKSTFDWNLRRKRLKILPCCVLKWQIKSKSLYIPKNCVEVLCVGYPQQWIIKWRTRTKHTHIKTLILAHSFATPTQNAKHQETINGMLNIGTRLVVYPRPVVSFKWISPRRKVLRFDCITPSLKFEAFPALTFWRSKRTRNCGILNFCHLIL